jgi:hypothetical protein
MKNCPHCGKSLEPSLPLDDRDDFEIFWSHAHRRVGKVAAKRAFMNAVLRVAAERNIHRSHAAAWITGRMKVFADSQQVQDPVQGKLHPSTWLNEGRYDDDEQTWNEHRSSHPVGSEAYKIEQQAIEARERAQRARGEAKKRRELIKRFTR